MKRIYLMLILNLALLINSQMNFKRELIEDYEIYVLAVQWGNNICKYDAKPAEQAQCKEKLAWMPKNTFSLHGLWPNHNTSSTAACYRGEENIKIVDDGSALFKRMNRHWTSITGYETNELFWGYEYTKHGYCYSNYIENYDPKVFFQQALEIFDKHGIETMFTDLLGQKPAGTFTIPYSELQDKLNTKYTTASGEPFYHLECPSNNKYLIKEIRFTFNKDFEPIKDQSKMTCNTDKDLIIEFF